MDEKKTRILVARPDRIGDVVLSTPVFEALMRDNPRAKVYCLVRDMVVPVVEHNPHLAGIVSYKPNTVHSGLGGFLRLIKEIRTFKFNIAIVLQASFIVSAACFFAGIRYRVGPYSKWFSFLFFNRGMRQNRSAVEMHEADYNLMLLRKLGIRVASRQFEPLVVVDAEAKDRVRTILNKSGITEKDSFVVVHPGMGGSAINWPEGYYIDLVQRLATLGLNVIVTGLHQEKALVEKVVANSKEQNSKLSIYPFLGVHSASGLADFIALLSMSEAVVSPSTGPLHLASALGRKTTSFFSPIKVQSALRWGPYTKNESKHSVLVPDVLCGQDYKCLGKKCPFYFCMERLGVEEAFQNIKAQLEKHS